MATKTKIFFKVLRQSAAVGGKLYGVIDNANAVSPEVSMAEVIDLKKLNNYSAKQLAAVMDDIIQGAAELVARDGRPRLLSSLLKFEGKIRGTFSNADERLTTQDVIVRPRLLKDIKIGIDKSKFEFVNTNDSDGPVIDSIVQQTDNFEWTVAKAFKTTSRLTSAGSLSITGSALIPTGWSADGGQMVIEVLRNGIVLGRADKYTWEIEGEMENGHAAGMWDCTTPLVAASNAISFASYTAPDSSGREDTPLWRMGDLYAEHVHYAPAAGDVFRFSFTRLVGGDPFTLVREITLA